jgi:hypothetical protein
MRILTVISRRLYVLFLGLQPQAWVVALQDKLRWAGAGESFQGSRIEYTPGQCPEKTPTGNPSSHQSQ